MPNNPQDQSFNDWLMFGTQPAPEDARRQKPERSPRRAKNAPASDDPFAALFEPVQSPVEPVQDPFFVSAPAPVPAPVYTPAAPVAAPVPATPAAPVAMPAAGSTVKLYDAAQSIQAQPAPETPAEPEVPAEPTFDAAPAEGTVKLYHTQETPSAPAAPAVPEAPAAPMPAAESTVKLYADQSVNASAVPPVQIDPAASMRAAGALKPVQLPDELRHFSPGEVEQTVSRLCIQYNGQTYTFDKPLEISIGRRAGNTMVVPDMHVSSDHAVLNCTYSGVTARNISQVRNGRQNPVYVNDVELRQPTLLNNGDILKLNCVPLTITWVTETVNRAAPARPVALPEPFTPAEPPVVMELPVAPAAPLTPPEPVVVKEPIVPAAPVVEPVIPAEPAREAAPVVPAEPVSEPVVPAAPVVEPESAAPAVPETPVPVQSAWTTVVPTQQVPDASATLQSLYLTLRWTLPGQEPCEQTAALNCLRPLVIGRSEKDDVFIDDPRRSVSRNHLTLTMEGSMVTVHNSSTDASGNPGYNPVLVNGKKLEGPMPLDDCLDREIRLGFALLTIRLAE